MGLWLDHCVGILTGARRLVVGYYDLEGLLFGIVSLYSTVRLAGNEDSSKIKGM